jgi:NAD-dependent dihydropyrimidine dehydrogenase PreA subunit
VQRQIIRIDEEKCDGCGLCAQGCPEGALAVIDGKARLVSEITCDGLGACIGECPLGAITVETRDAAAYDEDVVIEAIAQKGANTLRAHLGHLNDHGQTRYLQQALAWLAARGHPIPDYQRPTMSGCPGSAARSIERSTTGGAPRDGLESQLAQWPVQLHLINPQQPAFHKANLVLAADCVAFAMADFNQRWLPGKKLAIACPKLDDGQDSYLEKLVALIDEAEVDTITVMIMEVPCCSGLLRLAQQAVAKATRTVPIKAVVVGIDGEVQKEAWV